MSNIAIVSPGYPDQPGGVADHTARLARRWGQWGHTVHVVGDPHEPPHRVVERLSDLGTEAILIQYVPFLYARRGLSRFPERLATLARRRRIAVTTFVHEPWVPPTRLPWWVLSPLQRRQLRRLLGRSGKIVTAVPHWRDLLPGTVELVYVGSTLGEPDDEPLPPELSAPVVFSPFAAGLNWSWISRAVNALSALHGLVVVGADADTARAHPAVHSWFNAGWDWRGRLTNQEVLRMLSAARVVLAPFVDGLTGRRTSALAAGSTGAVVISSNGELADPALSGGPFVLANTVEEFVSAAQRAWHEPVSRSARAARRAWYRERLDASQLDQRLLEVVAA